MRDLLAKKYIKGEGIEIGALHFPTKVPEGVKVTYVDQHPLAVKKNHGDVTPAVKDWVVDNATYLWEFRVGSLDFIMAHHVLEHLPDALQALETWIKTLKPGGILFFSLPNKEHCFDRKRPVTPFAHLLADYFSERGALDYEHYIDWFMNSELEGSHSVNTAVSKARRAYEDNQNIHFHVWDKPAMLEMIERTKEVFDLDYELLEKADNGGEVLFVIKKGGA